VPTDAIVKLLLHHVPPAVALAKVAVDPEHTDVVPVIATGRAFTVTFFVMMQPEGTVYVIVALPADIPETMPVAELTAATAEALEDHVPPPIELLKAIVEPTHTEDDPEIAAGNELTVTGVVL
jgi:hypothetical protein